jgi:hypothetical protein
MKGRRAKQLFGRQPILGINSDIKLAQKIHLKRIGDGKVGEGRAGRVKRVNSRLEEDFFMMDEGSMAMYGMSGCGRVERGDSGGNGCKDSYIDEISGGFMGKELQAKIDGIKMNVENIGVFKSWHYKQNVEKMKKVGDKVRSKSLMYKKIEGSEFEEWKGPKLKRASEFQQGAAEKFSKQYWKDKKEAIEKEMIDSTYWQRRGSEEHSTKRKMRNSIKYQNNMLKTVFGKNG